MQVGDGATGDHCGCTASAAQSSVGCHNSCDPGSICMASTPPPILLSLRPQGVEQQLTDLKAQVDRMEELLRRALADRQHEK